MNQKYTTLILGGIGFLAVLGIFLYFGVGSRGTSTSTPTPSGEVNGGDPFPRTSGSSSGGSGSSGTGGNSFPTTSSSGTPPPTVRSSHVLENITYFNRISGSVRLVAVNEQGEFFMGDEQGVFTKQEGTIGDEPVEVSRDGLKVLRKRVEGQRVLWIVSDFAAKKEYVLGNDDTVHSPVFSYDSKKLYFEYRDTAKNIRYLASSNLNLSGLKKLFSINFLDMNMVRLGKDKLFFVPRPSGYVYGTTYSFSLKDSKLTELFSGYGMSAFPSEDGTRIFYSMTESNGRNVKLGMYDVLKHTNKDLGLHTFAEKCAESATSLICALPSQLDQTLVYPDSYYQGLVTTGDDMVKLDPLTTAVQKLITLTPREEVQAKSLVLTADGSAVFFVNTRDHALYRLPL